MRESSAIFNYNVDDEFFKLIEASGFEKGKLSVSVEVKKGIGAYSLNFHIEGVVTGICDRCLDEVEVDIDTDNTLKVKLGNEFSDEDEILIIPEDEGIINIAWYIYEFAYLSLPCRIVHEEGECNEQMQEKLNDLIRYDSNEVTEDAYDDEEGTEADADDTEVKATDPRWDALKKILNNN